MIIFDKKIVCRIPFTNGMMFIGGVKCADDGWQLTQKNGDITTSVVALNILRRPSERSPVVSVVLGCMQFAVLIARL